jgi:hypothetical protein
MMTEDIQSVSMSNKAAGFSAFGGHLLTPAGEEDTAARREDDAAAPSIKLESLTSLGIEDAEQLVAIACIPGVQQELQSTLGADTTALEQLLDRAKAVLPRERAALVSSPAPRDLGLGALAPTT